METLKNLIKHGVQIVDKETAHKIIETRKPLGAFVTINDEMIIAIDNTAGDAWTEDFNTKEAATMWITGEVDTEQAYEIDSKLSEVAEREGLIVGELTALLIQVNHNLEVKKENGMPVEKITIEIDNEGNKYLKIC